MRDALFVFAGIAVLAVLFVWIRRKSSGGGFVIEKPGEQEPTGWRVERRKQFAGEPERDAKGVLLWYPVDPEALAYGFKEDAIAASVQYSKTWDDILTRVVAVYADKEG